MSFSIHNELHPATVRNNLFAIIALTVLLYLLGVLGVLVVYSNNMLVYFKENIPFYIELKDNANEADVFRFQKSLESSKFVKAGSVRYITEEEALKELLADSEIKEEDVMLFGENLLPNFIYFNLQSEHLAQAHKIIEDIRANNFVADVSHLEEAVKKTNTNLQVLGMITFLLVIFFIFVAITLIKNTLKLSILSNKSTIKTLRIVGASWHYLTTPYIQRSIVYGLLSGFIAVLLLLTTLFILENQSKDLQDFANWVSFVGIFIALMGLGVLIYWGSTQHSISKYFNLPVEEWTEKNMN